MAATVYTGHETSYTSAVVVLRQLESHIDNFDPKEFPLLRQVGFNSYSEPVVNTKVEWQRDENIPVTDLLASAISSITDTTITATYAEYFALNDLILLDSELCLVTSIDETNNYLYVVRGFAGSTAATHSSGITIHRLGAARPEGSSPGWSQQTLTSQPYNYTQIWDATVSITGTEEALKNYAPDDLMAYRLDKRMAELYQMMEKAYIYNGFRYVGTATYGRVSGGLNYWVADKNNLSSAAFTFDDIEDAMQDKFTSFGLVNVPDSLWVNAWPKRKISSWGIPTIQTGRTESVVGNEITTLETNFGTISVNLDHLISTSEAWLLNMSTLQMAPLQGRGFKEIDASVAGDDLRRTRVLGEYVFVIKGEDGSNDGLNVKIYGISTTT